MSDFGKKDILRLLKEFDGCLEEPVEIIICGGAAAIVQKYLNRGTLDIDILKAIPKLSKIKAAKLKIAEKNELSEDWLNDGAKGFIDFLPDDFIYRLTIINGDFKNLTVKVLSKVDLVIMKLAAFRPEDLVDIDRMKIDEEDIKIIKNAILKIANINKKKAYTIEMYLKEKKLL